MEIYANNASGELAASIGPDDTVIELREGHTFPAPSGDEWFRATIFRREYGHAGIVEHDHEVVRVNQVDGNALYVERGIEGERRSHEELAPVELRLTAGSMRAVHREIRDSRAHATAMSIIFGSS